MSRYVAIYTGNFQETDFQLVRPTRKLFRFVRGVPKVITAQDALALAEEVDVVVQELPDDVDPLTLYREEKRRYVLRRTHALGDVVLVHAAAQTWLRQNPDLELGLCVNWPFLELMRAQGIYSLGVWDVQEGAIPKEAKVLNMNGILEADHWEDTPDWNRAWFAMEYLSKERQMDLTQVEPDWALRVPEQGRQWAFKELDRVGIPPKADRDFPVVAIATQTGGPGRRLKGGLTQKFVDLVVANHPDLRVVIPDKSPAVKPAPRVHTFPGSTVEELCGLLQECDVVCCPHTGILWLAHCFSLPTLVWLGTHPAEACAHLHPLWPEKVRALQMNEWVTDVQGPGIEGCPPCMERAGACRGRYTCLRAPDEGRFLTESLHALQELLCGPPAGDS